MRGTLKSTCVIVGFLFVLSVLSEAQVIVHALTGTVSSMNNTTKTITVLQDNGTIGVFKKVSIPSTHLIFDKRLAAGTTDVDACKRGTYAIVFYYGDSEDPTVVALKSLGAGPFKSTTGTVERFDSRAHSLSVKDTSGAELTFEINADTVQETYLGSVDGTKFHAEKGDKVRLVSATIDGNPMALFVRDM